MSRSGLTCSIVLACCLLLGTASGGSAAALGGGSRGLVTSKIDAEMDSISCAAPGDCAAGGYYTRSNSRTQEPSQPQSYFVSETNGTWGIPIDVPGVPKLSGRGFAQVSSISCAAAGECAAGGEYVDGSGRQQVFVVSEANGTWGKAIEVPGTATLNTDGYAGIDSISCGAAGDCAAAGFYYGSGAKDAFVVSETNGHWTAAIEVPGTATLNSGGYAEAYSISCAAAGECAAGGYYTGDPPDYRAQPFVVSETTGTWGTAIDVPGMATLNAGGDARVSSISCPAPGKCEVGGDYTDAAGESQVFVAAETSGSWDDATEVPGTAALNTGGDAGLSSISCPAVGECAAGGYYGDASGDRQAFVVSEASGSWGDAIEVPGSATLNSGDYGGDAEVNSISCAAPGDCAGGGFFGGCCGRSVLVVSETHGTWNNAIKAPPGTTSSDPWASVASISCAPAGGCTAGGFFNTGDPDYYDRAFVIGETHGNWADATQLRSFPALCFVPSLMGRSIDVAKKKLSAASCRLGRITVAYSTAKTGSVIGQQAKPRTLLKPLAKVALTVSKGRK